jgi:hypothetical protein
MVEAIIDASVNERALYTRSNWPAVTGNIMAFDGLGSPVFSVLLLTSSWTRCEKNGENLTKPSLSSRPEIQSDALRLRENCSVELE